MIVVSTFDGMSCLRLALIKGGFHVDKYYAIEIDPTAIKCTQHNFPDTIQLGDIRNVRGVDIGWCDLFAGGSPCQDVSRANKDITGFNGDKSALFYEYVRLYHELKAINPKIKFFLENVLMSDESLAIVNDRLGVTPIRINSEVMSAQLRDRLYWCNFGPANYDLFGSRLCSIPQPADRGITLQSILTHGHTDRLKSRALLQTDHKTSNVQERMYHRYHVSGFNTIVYDSPDLDWQKGIRWFNRTERERLQTVPEGYTSCISERQAAGLLGDGWTVDIITYMLSFINN